MKNVAVQKYQFLVDNILDTIFEMDLNGKIIYISPQCVDLLGYHQNELINASILDYVHQDDLSYVNESILKAKQSQSVFFSEFRTIHKNGNNIYISAKGNLVNANGKQSILAVGRDITEKKRIENHLKESEEKYRLIIENANDMIFMLNERLEIEYINEEIFKKYMGYTKDDLIGRNSIENIHPEDIKKVSTNIFKNFESGDETTVLRIKDKSGSYHWQEVHGQRIIDSNGKKKAILIGRDITDRKKTEEKLKQSKELLDKITNQTFMGFAIFQDFEIKYFNPAFSKVIGYSEKEILSWKVREFFKIIHPDDKNKLITLAEKLYSGDNEALNFFHFQINKKSGQVIWVETQTKTIIYNGKKADMVFIQNITPKIEAEQKLRESEDQYRNLINNLTDIILKVDLKGFVTYVSPQCYNVIGYQPNELIGNNSLNYVKSEDWSKITEAMKKALNSRVAISIKEYGLLHKDGTIITASANGKYVNINGNEGFIVAIRDITIQKRIELKLKESEERYRLITEHANDLIDVLDDKFRYEYMNEETHKRVLGYTKDDMIGKFAGNFVHPDELHDIVKKLRYGFANSVGMAECRIKKKDGTYIWYESKGNIFRDKEGNKKALIMSRDITERRLAEKKLRRSEALLTDAQRIAHLGHWEWNIKTNELFWSDELYRMYKRPRDYKPTIREWLTHVHPDDFEIYFNSIRDNISAKNIHSKEFRILCTDGEMKHIHAEWEIDRNEQHKPIRAFGTILDITKRKIAEQKLRESEEKFSKAFNNHLVAMAISDLKEGRFIECNEVFVNNLGLKREDVIGKTVLELNLWSDKDSRDEIIRSVQEKGNVSNLEIITETKDGEFSCYSFSANLIEINNEPFLLSMSNNITDRILAERNLKESEEKYRLISENANDLIVIIDKNSIIEYINKRPLVRNYGYTPEEIIGKDIKSFINPDYLESYGLNVKNLFRRDKGTIELELRHKRGYYCPVEVSVSIYFDMNNEPKQLIFVRDITARKRTEQKLKESEEKYRNIIEKANEGYFEVDLKGNYMLVNDAYCKLFEYTREELIGTNYRSFITEEMGKRTFKVFNTVYKTGIDLLNSEYEVITKSGNIKYGESSIYLRYDAEGKKIGFRGFLRDITEKKIAEEKLKESEEKYRKIIENAKEGYFEVDLKGNFTLCNEALCKLFEYPVEELIGMNYREYTTKEMSKKVFKAFNTVYLTGIEQESFEYEVITKNGNIIYGETTIHLRYDSEGKKIGFSGFLRDITEKKRAEMELRESEEKFRHLFEHSPFSIILFDSNGIILDCNSAIEQTFGWSRQELINQNYRQIQNLHPKQQMILKERFQTFTTGENVEPVELQITRRDGSIRWINSRVSKITIKNQTLFYLIIQDITERKILENLMFELNQVFFNFTANVKENIQLLLKTVSKISKGKLVLYARRFFDKDKEVAQIITSNNEFYNHNIENFKKIYFMSEIFEDNHELPQIFSNLHENSQLRGDPFIQKHNIKGAYGKVINSQEEYKSAISILYQKNPEVDDEDQLILLLISDAIAIEEQRWQLLQKLEEQNKKLSEIDKLKSEFLRRISHELKTPLISIKGYSELILHQNREYFDIDTISMIEEIVQGCSRLENLVIELLKTSKLETGQIELKISVEDLAFLIRFTVKELQGLAKTRNQKIILDVHENLITKFEKERIHEVVGNLLTNAIKYTPPYGIIEVKSEIKDNYYLISVKDNGIGFTEEEKQKVFKQFGKIEHYGRGSYISTEGTGLGLYITKKLVELHGGEIWMESEGRNKGSVFYFTLPIIKD